ncbi:MAG: C-GCAxxG-C-C family protein [Oscillospiraceae bacterium]|nr:C-GCAxxG-C-C family protein [Oscillospiraceae bacterium]
MSENLKEKAADYSRNGDYNCAESTLLAANDLYGLGLSQEDAKLMGGFGGGLASGLACGALCGSVAVMGKLALQGPAHKQPDFRAMCAEYVNAFRETMGGVQCSELKSCYYVQGQGCVRAIEKNAALLESFIAEHDLIEP